jgi:hypothetical protein
MDAVRNVFDNSNYRTFHSLPYSRRLAAPRVATDPTFSANC